MSKQDGFAPSENRLVLGMGKYSLNTFLVYAIKAVDERGTIPVDYKIYRTEEAARRAASDLGFTVSAVGDFWHLMHAFRMEAVQ